MRSWAVWALLAQLGCASLEPAQIQTAGRMGKRDQLERWLADDRAWVREEAALALALDPEAGGLLVRVVANGEESSWVRAAAAKSLGIVGSKDTVVPLLLGIAATPNAEPELKLAAIEASCRLGGAEAVAGLAPVARDEDLLVAAAAERMVLRRCAL